VPVIDLNKMHYAIHQISGDMALRFYKATADDLKRWVKMLRQLARDMEEAAEEAAVAVREETHSGGVRQ
jgi:hypothetical protein